MGQVKDKASDFGEPNTNETNEDGTSKRKKCYLKNPWAAGKLKMKEVNYLEVRQSKHKRNQRKCRAGLVNSF